MFTTALLWVMGIICYFGAAVLLGKCMSLNYLPRDEYEVIEEEKDFNAYIRKRKME